MKYFLTCAVLLLLPFQSARADFLVYEYSGVLPAGASQHSQVSDFESWTAEFVIDTNAADISNDPNVGFYDGNVVSGNISFSGGYSQELVVDDWFTIVFNDAQIGAFTIDAVSVRNFEGTTPFPVVQAHVAEIGNNPFLTDDSLLAEGESFTSSGNIAPGFLFQLRFEDQITGEVVEYDTNSAINVSFNASVVPEPASALILGCLGAALFRRRQR